MTEGAKKVAGCPSQRGASGEDMGKEGHLISKGRGCQRKVIESQCGSTKDKRQAVSGDAGMRTGHREGEKGIVWTAGW